MYSKIIVSLLILAAPAWIHAQQCTTCVPVSTVHDSELHNPCASAGQDKYCTGIIRKTTKHTIAWPDGSLESAWLTAYGRSACAASCMKDWIGAPYRHTGCWPVFYAPVKTVRNYYAAAVDNTTDVEMAWCHIMSYVVDVFCTGATGPYRYISIDHSCQNCPSFDRDQDGYISMAAGGNDCNDFYGFIHPGAPPICYPGYDVNCNGTMDYLEPACVSSPVVVDLGKDGIPLTSKADGVLFDLDADGNREQLSWTTPGEEDAWLCLDRNGNGSIDDGTELFGSYTPQPDPPEGAEYNGFLALAVLDSPPSGGNGNGAMDAGDSAFADLLLWRDLNHNGVSEPEELTRLEASGIDEISLDYRLSRKTDEHGNRYRYRTKLVLENSSGIDNWAWDVFLLR